MLGGQDVAAPWPTFFRPSSPPRGQTVVAPDASVAKGCAYLAVRGADGQCFDEPFAEDS
jgi:hypothetical protein